MKSNRKMVGCPANFILSYELYPFDVMVSVGETTERIIKRINKTEYKLNEKEIAALEMNGRGRTVLLEGGGTVLRLKSFNGDPASMGTLAHEVFHAVTCLFDKIGICISQDSDEAAAYAIEYLTREILQRLTGGKSQRGAKK